MLKICICGRAYKMSDKSDSSLQNPDEPKIHHFVSVVNTCSAKSSLMPYESNLYIKILF